MTQFNEPPYELPPPIGEKPRPILLERFRVVLGHIVYAPDNWDIVRIGPMRSGDMILCCASLVDGVIKFDEADMKLCKRLALDDASTWQMVIRFNGDRRASYSKRASTVKPMRIKGK